MKNILVYTQLIEQEIDAIRSFLPDGRQSFQDEMTRDAVAYGVIRIARQLEALLRALAANEADFAPGALQDLAGQLETRLIDADFEKVWHNVEVVLPAIEAEAERLRALVELTPERFYRHQKPAAPSGTLAGLKARRDDLLAIANRFHATDIRVFGSVARGDDTSASDVDFLVRLPDDASLATLIQLSDSWRELLGREVNVVSDRTIQPLMRESILRDAVLL